MRAPEGCCPNCGLPLSKEPPAFKAMPDVPQAMNPIERLEALAKLAETGNIGNERCAAELRAIIEALKQRDEAVREVAEEMRNAAEEEAPPKYEGLLYRWADRLEGK